MPINEIVSPLTNPPDVPVIADGQTTFNTKASAWLSYWKNNIYTEINEFIDKLNIFTTEVNTTAVEVENNMNDTADIKTATQQIHDDTADIEIATQQIHDDTADIKTATVEYVDNTYGSSNLWNIVNVSTTTYTASVLDLIRVDATTIGSDVTITLPTSPTDGDVIQIKNVDLIRTNTVTIARGNALHMIDGKLEDGEFNCNCSIKLVFDTITSNWMKG